MAQGSGPEFKSLSRSEKRAEIKRIKKERKILRKDLRAKGVKKRSDFEYFARILGLALPEDSVAGAVALFLLNASRIARIAYATMGIYGILAGATATLGAMLIYTYVTEQKGHFTINMTADMMKEGFLLSETPDFENEKYRLYTDQIKNVNAITIDSINRGVWSIDGSHNGPGYLAYTFYIKNDGTETTNYAYTMNITSQTMNADQAAWIMFFEDDKQQIYARMSADGNPEELYGYQTRPFAEFAYDADSQYYIEDGRAGIITTPFIDEYTALQGLVEDFEPGEVKKYTIVIWLEGDDPECTNAILGGHVGFTVQFDRLGIDEEGFFKGLYRTEYELTQSGVKPEDLEDVETDINENIEVDTYVEPIQ